MTNYVVIYEDTTNNDEGGDTGPLSVLRVVTARNREHAERLVADTLGDAELEQGVTLRAVPQRIWDGSRNTFKAETRRRLLRS